MPKPPTKIEKLPMMAPAMLTASKIFVIALAMSSGRLMAKLSSSKDFKPLRLRNKPLISPSSHCNLLSVDLPFTAITGSIQPFLMRYISAKVL